MRLDRARSVATAARGLTYSRVVSTLALFIALGGSAFAVARIGSGDVRDNSLRGADVRDRSLTGRDVRRGGIGSQEVSGLRLRDFASGALAQRDRVASGQTLSGVFAATVTGGIDDSGVGRGAISFPVPMDEPPVPTYVHPGGSGGRPCPGTAADPQAARGSLCLYETGSLGTINSRGVFDPVTGRNHEASRFGAIAFVNGQAGAAIRGIWAVTAR